MKRLPAGKKTEIFGIKKTNLVRISLLLNITFIGIGWVVLTKPQVLSPLSDNPVYAMEAPKEAPLTIDQMVEKHSTKYSDRLGKSHTKALLHCLLNKESHYGEDKGMGDGGLAGGILQFHESTYIGYRKIMIKSGLVKSIGDRFDYENAIETTAWAINDGRGNAWGPILRGECE